jgi:hypothetical protein
VGSKLCFSKSKYKKIVSPLIFSIPQFYCLCTQIQAKDVADPTKSNKQQQHQQQQQQQLRTTPPPPTTTTIILNLCQ